MRLYDPTTSGAKKSIARAAVLPNLDGLTIGILENGKLNAREMLQELGQLFESRNNCTIKAVYSKSNASAPARRDLLATAAKEVDFLITGLGD
ncbi:MAG: hypothetical protein ACK5JT_10960 [Hyphomicrobiaceae bacterium]